MQLPAPGRNVVLKFCHPVDDGHEGSILKVQVTPTLVGRTGRTAGNNWTVAAIFANTGLPPEAALQTI
jgi:hypothetical protein